MSPNSSAVLGAAPRSRLGTASGMLAQMRINGQALGIAASGAVVAARVPVHIGELGRRVAPALAQREAFVLSVHDAFAVAAVVCSVGILTSLVRGPRRPGEHPTPPNAAAG